MDNFQVFRIKNPEGKYSTGGIRPSFTNTGKKWYYLNTIKAHLAQFSTEQLEEVYGDCEVEHAVYQKVHQVSTKVLDF